MRRECLWGRGGTGIRDRLKIGFAEVWSLCTCGFESHRPFRSLGKTKFHPHRSMWNVTGRGSFRA